MWSFADLKHANGNSIGMNNLVYPLSKSNLQYLLLGGGIHGAPKMSRPMPHVSRPMPHSTPHISRPPTGGIKPNIGHPGVHPNHPGLKTPTGHSGVSPNHPGLK